MANRAKLNSRERDLRKKLLELGQTMPADGSDLTKEQIRTFHQAQRLWRIASLDGSFDPTLTTLNESLATPEQIEIGAISPWLVPVRGGSKESDLFSAATLTWSVPVSQGFGRRMRFLVRDRANGKLIGIIGLTDPVFNLRARDAWVGWSSEERKERLVHVMDAFVLGALPPYSFLLGGKLIALLATSREVVRAFRSKYGKTQGVISERCKDPRLVMLTVTSALGRSSIYNRLHVPDGVRFLTNVEPERVPIWFTRGYGHFHVNPQVFEEMIVLLRRRGHSYVKGNRFGDGPNWKLRVIRTALEELGLSADLLKHGIQRQVFLAPLACNTRSFLRGRSKTPKYNTLRVDDITEFWKERWAKPRSRRRPSWKEWLPGELLEDLRDLRLSAASRSL